MKTLCKVFRHRASLPRSREFTLSYKRMGVQVDQGNHSDLWKCEYQTREVAIKVLKVDRTSDFNKISQVGCSRGY